MAVSSIHSKNICTNPSFQGALQHKLSKRLYQKDELDKMLNDYSEEERYLGSLPPSWVKDFTPDEIGERTELVFKTFSEFAKSVYELEENRCAIEERKLRELEFEIAALQGKTLQNNLIEEKWEEYSRCLEKLVNKFEEDDYVKLCEKLSSELSNLLNKKIDAKYLDDGTFGVVFLISADEEKYSLKVFKPLESEINDNGGTVEPANAIYADRMMKPERCAKVYCGKVASDNENDAFILTKYIEPEACDLRRMNDVLKWIYNADMLSNRFTFTDVKPSDPFNGNFINGTLVDFGGIEFTCKSAKEYKLMKQLHQAIKSGDTQKIRKIKAEHGKSEEFENCMRRILSYAELLSNRNFMAAHDKIYSSSTDKMIKGFKELGVKLVRFDDDAWQYLYDAN